MSSESSFLPQAPDGAFDNFDIVLVSGDAYVDHPSFGAPLVGRYLERLGYRVGILAQPDWRSSEPFKRFGRPRLFFGVTAGNLDSMVAHYTPDRRRRSRDAYSPGGRTDMRPDHATVVYAQRCKEAYPEVPVVLGGVEASLRRLAHYDFVQQKIRGSVLIDAKAEYLVYGMAERTIGQLAAALRGGAPREEIRGLRGLAYRSVEASSDALELPAFDTAAAGREGFFEFSRALYEAETQSPGRPLAQRHEGALVVVNPPAEPLSPEELDAVYQLPFSRRYPPAYEAEGGIPALEPVRFSVVTHRGCYGGCSFCAISAHQGRSVVSRPAAGILAEVRRLTEHPDFRGTVSDVGGPTANMYATSCRRGSDPCARPSCLAPEPCPKLDENGGRYLELLRDARKVPGVKHVFVASGLRYDLLMLPGQRRLFRELVHHHVGGHLRVAPEHVGTRVLRAMGKPYARIFREFQQLFRVIREETGKNVYLLPYFMTGHPGCNLRDAVDLALFVKTLGHFPEQVQDFTPTPMTRSACMFWTGRDPVTGEELFVPKGQEKEVQRALVQFRDYRNRASIIRGLERAGRVDVLQELYGPNWKLADRSAGPRGPRGRPMSASGTGPRGDRVRANTQQTSRGRR